MEIIRQNLMELMELPCFDMHRGVARDGVHQTERPHRRRLPKARSRHTSLQTTGDLRFDGDTPGGNPRVFPHTSRSVRMEAWMRVQYTVFLVYYETDENGCCFQNHCSNSWSFDSVKTQSRRCGDAWYKGGGVIDQGDGSTAAEEQVTFNITGRDAK